MPNAQNQLPGWLLRLQTSDVSNAGPVNCILSFGKTIPTVWISPWRILLAPRAHVHALPPIPAIWSKAATPPYFFAFFAFFAGRPARVQGSPRFHGGSVPSPRTTGRNNGAAGRTGSDSVVRAQDRGVHTDRRKIGKGWGNVKTHCLTAIKGKSAPAPRALSAENPQMALIHQLLPHFLEKSAPRKRLFCALSYKHHLPSP